MKTLIKNMKLTQKNKDMCIGCGLCASILSQKFKMNENGKAEIIEENIKEEELEIKGTELKTAIDYCPVKIINIEE